MNLNPTVRDGLIVSGKWIKKHLIFFIVILVIGFFTYNKWVAYRTPIRYEDLFVFQSNGNLTRFLKLTYTTSSAFLPYEKITVKAYYVPKEPIEIERAKKEETFVLFHGGVFTKNDINKNQASDYSSEEEKKVSAMDYIKDENSATLKLIPSEDVLNLYEGTCEIYYKKEGVFTVYLDGKRKGSPFHEPLEDPINPDAKKVKIGSPTELMNKKTNDLLFIISIAGFILTLYFEFFRNPDKGSQLIDQNVNPTKQGNATPKR